MGLPVPDPPLYRAQLRLRPWQATDVTAAAAAGSDPLISRYRYSLPKTEGAADDWITACETDRAAATRLELAIANPVTPVGSVSLTDFEHGNAMVRFWLLPQARGHGIATTALRLLSSWAFAHLEVGRLAAYVELDNRDSCAVLERCGFVQEGHLRRHMTSHDGTRVDTLLYGLLPDELI